MNRKILIKRTAKAMAGILKQEREKAGLSMTQTAAAAGISQQMVSYIERGMRNPSLEVLLRLADVLDTPLSQLIAAAEDAARK